MELLLDIRREMAEEADHDIDQFVQNIGVGAPKDKASTGKDERYRLNGSELRKAVATESR